MGTSAEIKQRASALAEKTDVNSITPKEVGGIMYDLASHGENVLRNGGTLGIRKVYESVAAMEADSTNPKDFWGDPIKKGNLVVIYDGTTTGVDNNKIYAFMKPGWELATKLDAGYAMRAETEEKLSELGSEIIEDKKERYAFEYNIIGRYVDTSNSFQNGYIDHNGKYVNYNSYYVTRPIYLVKGETLKACVDARDVCVLAETDREGNNYTPIINIDSVDGLYNLEYVAEKNMYISVCYRVIEYLYIIDKDAKKTANDIRYLNLSTYRFMEIPFDVSLSLTDEYINHSGNLISYSDYYISLPFILKRGETLKACVDARDVCVLAETDTLRNNFTPIINIGDNGGLVIFSFKAEEDILVSLCYRNLIYCYKNDLDSNTISSFIESEMIENACKEINDAANVFNNTSLDYKAVIKGKYLDYKGNIVTYESYSISNPIHLLEGEILYALVDARDVCVLAETDKNNSTFSPIININSAKSLRRIKYVAQKELYVSICYRYCVYCYTSSIDNSEKGLAKSFFDLKNQIESINIDGDNIDRVPNFVIHSSLSTYKRVLEYVDTKPYLLAHVTDIHSGKRDSYKHIGYLNTLNKTWGFNVLCNNGDIGLDVGETDDEAVNLMYKTKSLMNCTSPWLYCKGNHERLRSMTELGNVFMKPTKRQFPQIQFGSQNGLYGYIDDEDSKVRTVYLNTSDTDTQVHYAMSDEQIIWLGNTLLSTEDGYKIVILTHLCPKKIGEWTDYTGDWQAASGLVKVVEGFAQRITVSHLDKTWDYSQKKAKIVCVLSGDSHFNNFTKENGVNYIVRQGYGGISESSKPSGATSDGFNYESQCLFDVLVIKDNSNAKVFRIGVGNENRDLDISF